MQEGKGVYALFFSLHLFIPPVSRKMSFSLKDIHISILIIIWGPILEEATDAKIIW